MWCARSWRSWPDPVRAAGLALASLTLAAAAPAPPAAPAIRCSGGETLAPLVRTWAAGFSAAAVIVDPDAKLAAEGFRALLAGRADCAIFVREPFPSERARFRARFGHDPLLVPVARGSFATRGGTHAIAIYVNAANPLRGLTLAGVEAAFSGRPRGRRAPARTWGDLGLTGPWAARPLHVYGMIARRASGDPPGVVNYLEQRLGGGGWREDEAQIADRPREQALAAIVRKVAEDPDGIGYSGFGYARPGARALPIATRPGAPFVQGTAASVADGRYPLSRHVYLMTDDPPSPALKGFLRRVLSPWDQAAIGRDPEGFLPLTPAERARSLALFR